MNTSDDPWAAPASFGQGDPAAAAPPAPAAQRMGEEPDPWARARAPDRIGPGGREPATTAGTTTCYLLHFDRPLGPPGASAKNTASHYTGSTADLQARLAEHEKGQGARLLQVAKAAGITWRLARTWPGGRDRERQLKNQGGASRRCPECGVKPRSGTGARKQAAALNQPEPDEGAQAQDTGQSPEHARPAWVRAPLAADPSRVAASPAEAIPANQRQPRELNGPQLADMEAER
jgi:hypothetical protein